MTDRQLVIESLKALDESTPPAVMRVVARAAAAVMEIEDTAQWAMLGSIAASLGLKETSVPAILKAIDELKAKGTKARQATVLEHWSRQAKRTATKKRRR